MWPFRKKPKFEAPKSKVALVADMDKMETETIWFGFRDRAIAIPPVSAMDFFRATNAIAELDMLRSEKRIKSVDELEEGYARVFAIMCPAITREDVRGMSHQAAGAILNLCTEALTGKAYVDAEKKSSKKPEDKPAEKAGRL